MGKRFKYLSKNYPIHDAKAKVTGDMRYVADMKLHGMVHVKLIFSPYAYAKILSVDASEAESLPGVLKVYSAFNSPTVPFNITKLLPQQEDCPSDQMIFSDKARFVGDRIAAVVAETKEIAEVAAKLVKIEYRQLDAVCSLADALAANHQDYILGESNWQVGEMTVKGEDMVSVVSTVNTPRIHHAAMETHACIADWSFGDKLIVYSPCQGVYSIRMIVAETLKLPYNKVRVVKTPLGGSFGGKQAPILELPASWIAYDLKRPVKIEMNRKETIFGTVVRPYVTNTLETICRKDGKLESISLDYAIDSGAYATNAIDYIASMGSKIFRLYDIKNVKNTSKAVTTNNLISGGARGWGSPEFFTALEIHMDDVARKLNIDPVEFRLKNVVKPYQLDPKYGMNLENIRITDCIEKGAEIFKWKERKAKTKSKGHNVRGIGMACGSHKNGWYGGWPAFSSVYLKLNEDGSLILNCGAHDQGCGTCRSLQLIISEVLDIEPDLIEVLEADTEKGAFDFGTFGSRFTITTGAATEKAARLLKEKLIQAASKLLNKPEHYLLAENGFIKTKEGDEKISIREIAEQGIISLDMEFSVAVTHNATTNPSTPGAHFVEVEVNTLTGLVRVMDYVAVHDVGVTLNKGMCISQVQGAAQMGIGYALSEEIILDGEGKIKNEGLKGYHLVNAYDMPNVDVHFIEVGETEGPFGAKAIGEAATVPSAAAVVNAVNHALGTTLSDLPLTPEKILGGLKDKS